MTWSLVQVVTSCNFKFQCSLIFVTGSYSTTPIAQMVWLKTSPQTEKVLATVKQHLTYKVHDVYTVHTVECQKVPVRYPANSSL